MLGSERESDPWLVMAAVVIVLLGLLNLLSLGMTSHAVRHIIFAALGLAMMCVVSRLRVSELRAVGWALLAVATVMLAAVSIIGVTAKGAQRWLDLGVFTVQ